MDIQLSNLVIEDRLREVDPGAVKTIAESFKAIKQSVPVIVYKLSTGQFRLIDGGHRVAAAKALGWLQISADVKDFGALDEREIEFERKMIEIDTTLARADLNVGLETDLLEQRLRVVVEKSAYADAKKAKEEADEANKRRADALAKEKEAESDRAKKKAKAELDKADSARVNAAQKALRALERCNDISDTIRKNVTLPDNLSGVGAARKELALQTNRKPDTIEKALRWFDELGRDFVKKIYGTDLDNHMQYLAMSRFKKRYDEVTAHGFKRPDTPDGKVQAACDRLVKNYWPLLVKQIDRFKAGETNALPNPHAEWSDLIRDEKQGFKANEEARRIETTEGQWDRVRKLANELELLLAEFDNVLSSSKADDRIKFKSKVVSKMRVQASELKQWAQRG